MGLSGFCLITATDFYLDGKMEYMKRHEISEQQWDRIRDKFPPEKKPQGGRPGKSNRVMLNGILYWLDTGIPWRDLPERF
ncbi:MAG: transposase, partial [Oscillospiraceae bacterium]|nr:transposase [Oscillospiraceae bacterium]